VKAPEHLLFLLHKVLGVAYYNTNAPVLDDQLMCAGLRLAKLLNEIFE